MVCCLLLFFSGRRKKCSGQTSVPRVYCMINMQSSGMCRHMTCVPFITCIFFKHHPRGGRPTMIHCCENGCAAGARSHEGARSATRGRRRGRRGAWHLCNTTIARLLFYLYVQNRQRTHNTHVGARKKKKNVSPLAVWADPRKHQWRRTIKEEKHASRLRLKPRRRLSTCTSRLPRATSNARGACMKSSVFTHTRARKKREDSKWRVESFLLQYIF